MESSSFIAVSTQCVSDLFAFYLGASKYNRLVQSGIRQNMLKQFVLV